MVNMGCFVDSQGSAVLVFDPHPLLQRGLGIQCNYLKIFSYRQTRSFLKVAN